MSSENQSGRWASDNRSDRWFKIAVILAIPIVLVTWFSTRSPAGLTTLAARAFSLGSESMPKLGGAVTAIAYAPDGQLFVATDNNFVQVWKSDIKRWRSCTKPSNGGGYAYFTFLKTYQQSGSSSDIRLVGGGSPIFSQSMSNPGVVWDGSSRQPLFNVGFSMGGGIDVSSDGTKLATAGPDNICIFDLTATPQGPSSSDSIYHRPPMITKSRILSGKTPGLVVALAFSPDGKTLAGIGSNNLGYSSGGYYGNGSNAPVNPPILLWDVETGKQRGQLVSPPPAQDSRNPMYTQNYSYSDPQGLRSTALAFSPDGNSLVRVTMRGGIERWDLSTNKIAASIPESQERNIFGDFYCQAVFSPDGSLLATCDFKGIALRESQTLMETRRLDTSGPMAFSPDGSTLATGNKREHEVKLWSVS